LTTFVVCVAVIGQFKGVGQMPFPVDAVAQQYKTGKGGLVKPHQVPYKFFWGVMSSMCKHKGSSENCLGLL
jgi:hypothetical protein